MAIGRDVSKCVGNVQVVELSISIPLPDCGSEVIGGGVEERKVVCYRCGVLDV